MKKTMWSQHKAFQFPIVSAALLSLLFAFASIHYATHYTSTSTTGRLYAWFACSQSAA